MNPLFEGVAANDSKDLIIFLYENIHKEINNPQNQNNKFQNPINNPELQEFRTEYYPKNSSVIIDTFYFEHQNQIICKNCEFPRTNYNIYNILVFPLEKVREFMVKRFPGNLLKVTLENCFEQYQENEILSGNNQIYCNHCNQMADSANINNLYNSPEVLTIILNRGKGIQFDVEFDYPLLLNIDRFIIDPNCKNNNYELICVLSHLGESGMSGHFIAFCKSPVDGKWYMYNDAQVNECNNPKNPENTIIENLPYVLFYQRINLNKNNSNMITLYISYYDKEVYIDVEKEITISELINRLCKKYDFPNNLILFLSDNNNLIQLSPQSTIANYPNMKNGSKIIIKVY
jgi:ubiquitin carboxyl-terminal hydrolase 2/21